MFYKLCTIQLLRGSFSVLTRFKYSANSSIFTERAFRPYTLLQISFDRSPADTSLTSLRRCSTPTYSASEAPIEAGICIKFLSIFPFSSTSSLAQYASVGIPKISYSQTLITQKTGFELYLRNSSLIWISFCLILGPEEYHPTILSLALTFLNM